MFLGEAQLGDPNRIATKHGGRDVSRIIAGAENDDVGARDLPGQAFEIPIRSRSR
jgi:hypothetical protein